MMMLVIRDKNTNWIASYGENVEADDFTEEVWVEQDKEEFEALAREDAGLSEDDPLGDMYLEDEGVAFGVGKSDKPGRRVGHKRLKAYAPLETNAATELMDELGRKSNQSPTWGEVAELLRRIDG